MRLRDGRRGGSKPLRAAKAAPSRVLAKLAKLPRACTYDVRVERDVETEMPDGTILLADRWYPVTPPNPPAILLRSPYGRRPFGPVGRLFAERGYQAVIQSCRGTFGSGGAWEPFRDEQIDGRATLSWIAEQSWFGGSIGTWGPSYLGLNQWAVAHDPPATLRAIAPAVSTGTFRNLLYGHGSTLLLEPLLLWVTIVEHQEDGLRGVFRSTRTVREIWKRTAAVLPLTDADVAIVGHQVDFFQDWLTHNGPADLWWDSADYRGPMTDAPPMTLVGGWFDPFSLDMVTDFRALMDAGREARLTIGPWTHSSLALAAEAIRDGLDWFDMHLAGQRGPERHPVRLFVMGSNRWVDLPAWPPPSEVQRWHLRSGDRLDPVPPSDERPSCYRYDPADPTPSVGGAGLGFGRSSGQKDQRPRESRPDVLVFTSDPMPRNVTVAGVPSAQIHMRSSAPSTDLFVRLCDVSPKGRSLNICDGLVRVSGDGAIQLAMRPTAHTFCVGHRIRIQVSSGAFPLYARNLGSGEPLGTGTRLVPSDVQIIHDSEHPSGIDLPMSSI